MTPEVDASRTVSHVFSLPRGALATRWARGARRAASIAVETTVKMGLSKVKQSWSFFFFLHWF
jgi:hypothetical protein